MNLDRIIEIEHSLFPHPWSREALRDILHAENYLSYGIFAEKKLVGYLVIHEISDELHILNLAVDKKHQRKGLGSKLLEKVFEEAYFRKRRFAYLEVREGNVNAQKVYKSLGFRTITKRLNYYERSREDALLMMAKIKKPKKS